VNRYWIIDQKYAGYRIDEFLYLQHLSKRFVKDVKMKGDLLINGQHQTVRYLLQEEDVLVLVYPPENNQIQAQDISLSIVYEDDYLMVIYKQPGMPCIPTKAHPKDTLANALSYYYQHIGLSSTIHLVNRLDKETRGLMIVGKYREIHDLMSQQHLIRHYRAHVVGKVTSGTICLPIYRDGKAMKRIIDQRGKFSVTHYRCLQYQDGISLVECVLETGRTHQIRVHMSAIGHPLVGDPLYHDGKGEFDLESFMVAFIHPVTKQVKVIIKK